MKWNWQQTDWPNWRYDPQPLEVPEQQFLVGAGPEGFVGGLSAANYQAITKASPATARRDLVDLVAKGALRRTGERKGTRYWLSV